MNRGFSPRWQVVRTGRSSEINLSIKHFEIVFVSRMGTIEFHSPEVLAPTLNLRALATLCRNL